MKMKIYNKSSEAPNFFAPEYSAIGLKGVNVVLNGTTSGRATLDLVFEDSKGQKHIAMITGGLFDMIHGAMKGAESRVNDSKVH